MTDLIDTSAHIAKKLHKYAARLAGIADACDTLGMVDLATRVGQMADGLLEIDRELSQAIGKDCADRAKQADQATANMINGMLTMASMKEKSEQRGWGESL
jgi:hypothetical protein